MSSRHRLLYTRCHKWEVAHEWLVATCSPQAGFIWFERVERCFFGVYFF